VQLQPDVLLNRTHLRGNTVIQSGSRIGPGSLIENSHLGENVTVLYSVVMNSIVQAGTQIGPYAHLRSQVEVGPGCRVEFWVKKYHAGFQNECRPFVLFRRRHTRRSR